MKTRTFLMHMTVVAGLLCGFASQAVAQGQGGGGGGRGGVLTPEQMTKMRETMQASQDDMTKLTEKLSAAQKEAIKAVSAKDADEKSVRPKIEAVGKIQTDIAILRLKAAKEVASSLTDEQKTAIDARPGMAYNMLFGGGGGFGGGGRRGGGAGGGRAPGAGNN